MTLEKVRLAREMYDAHEYNVETIAKTLGVSRMTVYRHLDPTPTTDAKSSPPPPDS